MLKKNLFFTILTILIFSVTLYFLSFFYFKLAIDFSSQELIKNENQIRFFEKYTKRLHHLRHYKTDYIDFTDPKNLLFNLSEENKPNQENILFLGDSWFVQLLSYNSSKKKINDYIKGRNLNILNGAISSYSPSLMLIQYKILIQDFKLNPDYLIIYFDQNDFGDEICRYKNNLIFDNKNKLWGVKDYLFTPRLIYLSKIENDDIPIFLKELKKFNFYLKERLFLAYNKYFTKLRKNIYGCSPEKIFSYLIEPSKNDLDYFKKSLYRFLNYIYEDNQLKKILIVTFPHRNHLQNIVNLNKTRNYSIDIGDLIKEYSLGKEKMHHLNFSDLIKKNIFKIKEKDFMKNDKHSHLLEKSHLRFTNTILEKIDKIIK